MQTRKMFKGKKISIHLGIFLGYSLLMCLVVGAICFGALYATQKMIVNEVGMARIDVLSQIGARAKLIKNSMLTLSNLFYNDPVIAQAVNAPKNAIQESAQIEKIRSTIQNYEAAYKELDFGIYTVICSGNGFGYCSEPELKYDFSRIDKALWYKDVAKAQGAICWVSSYDDTYLNNGQHFVFSAARIYYDPMDQERDGILLINVPERILYDTYKIALNGNNSIYIVDAQGTIVSHNDPSLIGLNYYNMETFHKLVNANDFSIIKKVGQQYLLSNFYDEMTGWTIVEEIPLKTLMTPMGNLTEFIVGLTVFFLFVAFSLSYLLARMICNPLKILCRRMEHVKDGLVKVCNSAFGWNETKALERSFDQMVVDIGRLMDEVKEKEQKKRMAELDFLQMQINPHFLYNTLFSMKCMMEMGRCSDAVSMMDIFIPLLKEGISSSQEMIFIADECRWVQRFVELLQFRYEQKLNLCFELEPGLEKCYIPRMLLQPVVENSIYHGMDDGKDIQICVKVSSIPEGIQICVQDDGKGIDPQRLRQLELLQWQKNRFNKIGLVNVKERIQMIFGEDYGMVLDSDGICGTRVTLTIPRID